MDQDNDKHQEGAPQGQEKPSGPRKILDALEKAQERVEPLPPEPSRDPSPQDPGKEMLIPESMRRLEEMIKSIKQKKPDEKSSP